MNHYSVPIEVNGNVQLFRFYLDDEEYYIWSEGLELAVDRSMHIFYCDMPEHWKTLAMAKLKLLIKVINSNKNQFKSASS